MKSPALPAQPWAVSTASCPPLHLTPQSEMLQPLLMPGLDLQELAELGEVSQPAWYCAEVTPAAGEAEAWMWLRGVWLQKGIPTQERRGGAAQRQLLDLQIKHVWHLFFPWMRST